MLSLEKGLQVIFKVANKRYQTKKKPLCHNKTCFSPLHWLFFVIFPPVVISDSIESDASPKTERFVSYSLIDDRISLVLDVDLLDRWVCPQEKNKHNKYFTTEHCYGLMRIGLIMNGSTVKEEIDVGIMNRLDKKWKLFPCGRIASWWIHQARYAMSKNTIKLKP